LLSDQDSMPAPDMVARLLEAIEEDPAIAAVGPLPSEEREGADELVLGMIHEGLKSRQGHLGSAGEENAHDVSLRGDYGRGRSPRGRGILPPASLSFSRCEFR